MKNGFDRFVNRFNIIKERISEREDRIIKIL